MKTIACSLGLILVSVASVDADPHAPAPTSLRMRAHPSKPTSPDAQPRSLLVRRGKQVAQAATDQPADPAPPSGDPPSDAPPPAEPPAAEPAPADPAAPAAVPEQAPAAAPEAQPAAAPPSDLTDEELAKLAEQAAKEEIITVTGSTIERKTLATPAPVTILNRDDLGVTGRATVGDILQLMPEQSNAANGQVNNSGEGSTRISIRGLGANRTLTLINGRRVVAGGSGANNSVDINAIPLAVVERVEVLKDGASAIYGSDAIGGVVNIITRTDFSGTEVALYTGGSAHGDGFTYDASFVTGHTAQGKKGNIVFSAGIQSQDPVMADQRAFSSSLRIFDYANRVETNGNATTTPWGYLNAKSGIAGPNGSKPVARDICGAGIDYCTDDGNGGWRPFVDSDLYNPQPANYLYTPSSRYNVFSAGNYKFLPHVSTFFEASYLNRTSAQQQGATSFLSGTATISKDSMYNPFGADVIDYQRRFEEFGPRRFEQDIDTFRIVGGLQGTIPEDMPAFHDWKWELSYNYGRTSALNAVEGTLIKSRLTQSVGPSMPDASGKPTCVRTPGDLKTAIAGCVPINILGRFGAIDPASASWLGFTGISGGYNQQQTLLAQAHGRILELPNRGDLSVAVGADYRIEAGAINPDPLTATGDTTGFAQIPTSGEYKVSEGFAEVSLVPISGKKYVEWAELNLAARGFHYDTFGSGVTWKAGALFRTINGITVRGTYSTAFRAPSISDLFQGAVDTFPRDRDPCNTAGGTITLSPNVAQKCMEQGVPAGSTFAEVSTRTVVGGNADLTAETAHVVTAGVVFEPPQAKGLAFTADYWNIDITNAIQTLPASIILSNCYAQGLEPFCQLVHRNPAVNYKIDFIDDKTQNVGGTTTSGLDLAAAYDRTFGKWGRFHEQLGTQYLFKYNVDNSVQILHYRGNYDFGVYPKYKANLSTQWAHESGAGAGFNVRYIGSFKECPARDCNHNVLSRDITSWAKLDVFGSYTMKSPAGKTTLAVGINNVTNNQPAVIYAGLAGTSDSATYDYMGRFLYARLSQLF